MQAVILAAGVGSRLGAVSNGLPKCLLPIGDRPLIEHQLEALADAGIGPVLVVLGYEGDEVRNAVGYRAEYIENPRYEETNSLYSLWLARQWVTGAFVLINSDILFHPDVLDRLLTKGGNALAFDASSTSGQEQTKVFVREGRVWDLGKDLSPDLVRGESLGMLVFDSEGSAALFGRVDAMIKNGGEKSWVMEAVRSMCSAVHIRAVNVTGLPWVEMDFPFDVDRARKNVWPEIRRSRWKRTVHWRITRWIAAVVAAFVLVSAGVFIS
ncbi:MAG: phosphocholine cytidylyltransferase family protein, partial [Bacteroidota bacterium]